MTFPSLLENATIHGAITLNVTRDGLDLRIGKSGGRLLFPPDGVTEAAWLVTQMTYLGDKVLAFHLEFFREPPTGYHPAENPWKDPAYLEFLQRNFIQLNSILPRNRVTTGFNLQLLDGNRLMAPRTPGKLRGMIFGNVVRPAEVKAIGLHFVPHHEDQRVLLHALHFAEAEPDYTLREPVPIVDEMGQLKTTSWPGKTDTVAEMIALDQARLAEAEAPPATAIHSRFGGCAEKRFEPSGFFRLEKEGGRHYLVDPDGHLFFSIGINCVGVGRYDTCCRLTGIRGLCDWLPPQKGAFAPAYVAARNTEQETTPNEFFDFRVANLIRAHGPDWWQAWAKITRHQMAQWGFNTVANWSDAKFIEWSGLPHVIMFDTYPRTPRQIFRDFPDVFSPEFVTDARRYARQIIPHVTNPALIGYFMANEPQWGQVQGLNIAREMFRDETPWVSKARLIEFLADKYRQQIAALNTAWSARFTGFEQIRSLTYDQITGVIAADLMLFSRKMMAEYVRAPAVELKRQAPRHLNLGMRYAWIHSDIFYEGAENFDVFSTNRYAMYLHEPPHEHLVDEIVKRTGRPVLISEFHFGAPDRGCLGAGLKSLKNQEERGKAYRRYVEDAAAMPNVLGVHYFILNDQATLGRFDGEAAQIGLVDICGRPYDEFLSHARRAHTNIYPLIRGQQQPFQCIPEEIPMVF